MGIRTFGVFAHVDAGKTTLTEGILYYCKAIRRQGRVDQGTAHTDRMDIEKQRGISVQSCPVFFDYNDIRYHLIDTPGHLDFTHEVETALQVIDGAVIVISAVDGIQPHTQIILDEVKKFNIPALLFVNKIDRIGASVDKVITELKTCFSKNVIHMKRLENEHFIDYLIDILSEFDQDILEKYLNDEPLTNEELMDSLYKYSKRAKVFPVFEGAALHGVGIPELVEGIGNCFPDGGEKSEGNLSAVVFKVENNKTFGRMAYTRVYEGSLKVRQEVISKATGKVLKINRIKLYTGEKYIDSDILTAGEIGAVAGLQDIKAKEIIGEENKRFRKELTTGIPVMRVKTYPLDNRKTGEFLNALQILNDEDSALNLIWIPEKKEFNIDIFGPIQMEVLKSVLLNRFGLEAEFGEPAVIYMETPTKEGEGFERYTMPKPCWAVIHFLIKPLPTGSGVRFSSIVKHDVILHRYQHQIKEALPVALSQGLYGWKVTDIDITLVGGEYHIEHTKAPDFTVATPMAIMNGLKNTGTNLLEPVLYFDIKGPEEALGGTIKKLTEMRCLFDSPNISKGQFNMTGEMPVATSINFPVEFGILTHGKGVLKTKFLKHQICPPELGAICERRGVNPLDRSKYILSVRNAL